MRRELRLGEWTGIYAGKRQFFFSARHPHKNGVRYRNRYISFGMLAGGIGYRIAFAIFSKFLDSEGKGYFERVCDKIGDTREGQRAIFSVPRNTNKKYCKRKTTAPRSQRQLLEGLFQCFGVHTKGISRAKGEGDRKIYCLSLFPVVTPESQLIHFLLKS